MNKLKLSLVGLLLVASPMLHAQDQKEKGGRAEMEKELGITSDQKAKMEHIKSSYDTKFSVIKEDKVMSPEDKQLANKKLRKEMRQEMDQVLTAEQLEKRKTLKMDAKALPSKEMAPQKMSPRTSEKKEMTPQEKSTAKVEKLDKIVGLKGDQKTKVEKIYLDYAVQRAAIKTEGQSKETINAKKQKLAGKEKNEINKVLTTAQIKVWNEHIAAKKSEHQTAKPKRK